MMKRFLSLLLVCVLIVVMVLPSRASAAGNDNGWIELLEYISIQENGENWFTINGTSGSVTFPVHSFTRLRKIDMVLWNPSSDKITAASVSSGDSKTNLNVYQVASTLTRISGYVPNVWYNNINLNITKTGSGASTFQVLSCKVTTLGVQEFEAAGNVLVDGSTYKFGTSITGAARSGGTQSNTIRINVTDWMKYDTLSIWGSTTDMYPSSFRASVGTHGLPYDISYMAFVPTGDHIEINTNESGYYWPGEYEGEFEGNGSADGYSDTAVTGQYLFCLNIDLSGVDRTLTDPLYVYLTGVFTGWQGFKFNCQYVNGNVNTADTSEVTWWSKFTAFLGTKFTDLGAVVSGGFSNLDTWIKNQTGFIQTSLVYVRETIQLGFDRVGNWFHEFFGVRDKEPIDDLGENSDSISQDASDIHNFEQTQQVVLDTNFSTIQNAVTFTNFAAALVFVQKYTNMTFNGISDYAIVFTLPLFLGLFFYLCSRIPGITRWKTPPPRSKPKGGGKP